MTVTPETERWIALAGCYNFRDLGGYATTDGRHVVWRKLFRADGLQGLTTEDVARLHEMGLNVVIDLRAGNEIERDGRGGLFDSGVVQHRHHPFMAHVDERSPSDYATQYPSDMATLYQGLIERARPAIAATFVTLAEAESYPAVFHCAAGKDRTGITAGLILRVLGVPDDVIVQDYALTELAMQRRLAAIDAADTESQDRLAKIPRYLLRAEPQTMTKTLELIDTGYGSAEQFLLDTGVTQVQLDAVRSQLLT